jgi:hypothetical protein
MAVLPQGHDGGLDPGLAEHSAKARQGRRILTSDDVRRWRR